MYNFPQVAVALDVAGSDEIGPIVDGLPDRIAWYKVGLELFCSEGPAALDPLKRRGKRIFLDLKLHDIPRTVERAVRSAATHGIDLLTVHATGGRAMLEAAAGAAAECGDGGPRLVAITTLTSLDARDLTDIGVQRSPADQALALADLAMDAGIDGLVTSVLEVAALRARVGPDAILVTPGIRLRPEITPGHVRPAEGPSEDQKRVATPSTAVRSGSSLLVVGRPILNADDPHAAATRILEEMDTV